MNTGEQSALTRFFRGIAWGFFTLCVSVLLVAVTISAAILHVVL